MRSSCAVGDWIATSGNRREQPWGNGRQWRNSARRGSIRNGCHVRSGQAPLVDRTAAPFVPTQLGQHVPARSARSGGTQRSMDRPVRPRARSPQKYGLAAFLPQTIHCGRRQPRASSWLTYHARRRIPSMRPASTSSTPTRRRFSESIGATSTKPIASSSDERARHPCHARTAASPRSRIAVNRSRSRDRSRRCGDGLVNVVESATSGEASNRMSRRRASAPPRRTRVGCGRPRRRR